MSLIHPPKYNMKFILILILLFTLFIKSPLAIESDPETETKAENFVTNVLKPKVQGATATPSPISNKPKSFFGNITKIDEDVITITYKGQTQLIQTSEETVYIDLKRNKSKLTNFKVGQEILAMGYLKEDQSLDCKRIVATELKSVVNDNQTITGQIVDISKETSIFTLTPNYNKNNPFQLKTDSKTKIVNLLNKAITSSQAITNGNKIITIIRPDPKMAKTFYASKIIVLDSPDNLSLKINPTPSTKP